MPAKASCPGVRGTKETFKHEDYTYAIIRHLFPDIIDGSKHNRKPKVTAAEIADFLDTRATPSTPRLVLWRDIVSGQLDADRSDYLLRDSLHLGVAYGLYDLERILSTLAIVEKSGGGFSVGVESGGAHAAEALIIARYMMFTQVYFHRTRRAYDFHISGVLKHLLAEHDGVFPVPSGPDEVRSYLEWDDQRVMRAIDEGVGGIDGDAIRDRKHLKCLRQTKDVSTTADTSWYEGASVALSNKLGDSSVHLDKAPSKWYGLDRGIWIRPSDDDREHDAVRHAQTLDQWSPVVEALVPSTRLRLYVRREYEKRGLKALKSFENRKG